MNVGKSVSRLFISRVVTSLFQFLGIIYFARELGATGLGIYFLFEAVLSLLSFPADFGIRGALEKRISEGNNKSEFVGTAIILKLIPLTLVCIISLTLDNQLNNFIGGDYTDILVGSLVLRESFQTVIFILRGELRVDETADLIFLRRLLWLLIGVFFISTGIGPVGLMYASIISFLPAILWGLNKMSLSPTPPSRSYAYSLLDFGRYNIVAAFGKFSYSWVDIILIGYFLPPAAVGAYEVAWRLTTVVSLLSNSIGDAILPIMSRWESDGEERMIEELLPNSIAPSIILVIPAIFAISVLSDELLLYLYGDQYLLASQAVIILMVGRFFETFEDIFRRVMKSLDRPDITSIIIIFTLITNIIMNSVLIQWFGLSGAAIATTLTMLIGSILHGFGLHKFISVNLPVKETIWSSFTSILMIIPVYFVSDYIGDIYSLLIVVFTGVIIYFSLLFIISPLRKEILYITKTFIFN